jgi:hypothetical protein
MLASCRIAAMRCSLPPTTVLSKSISVLVIHSCLESQRNAGGVFGALKSDQSAVKVDQSPATTT